MKNMKYKIILIAMVLMFSISINGQPPVPCGIGGYITVNDVSIEDGIWVTVQNVNTGVYDNTTTDNGLYAAGLTASDGDVIRVNCSYMEANAINTTVVNTSHVTQWVNLSIIVELGENEIPVVDIGGPYSGFEGSSIDFSASESYDLDGYIISYNWCFYNGIEHYEYGENVSFKWMDDGNYTVKLTIMDNGSATNSTTTHVVVENVAPIANAGGPYSGDVGNSIIFSAAYSTDAGDDELCFRWDWTDDGIWDTEWLQNPMASHIYVENGSYIVALNVSDDDGGYDIDTAILTIGGSIPDDNQPPTANFTFEPIDPLVNESIVFTDLSNDSDGTIVNWTWSFGDGNHSYMQNPIHSYMINGIYTITLTVEDNNETNDSTTKIIEVLQLSPPENYTLTINVTDMNGDPIMDAAIEIYKGGNSIGVETTNSDGKATFLVESGIYTVKVFASGHNSKFDTINVLSDDQLDFQLEKEERNETNLAPYLTILSFGIVFGIIYLRKRK